jgi:signal transduction histidine kinase
VRNALQILRLPDTDLKTADWARAMIDRQVRHLARLIDDLLDMSRLTRGLIRLQPERLDLVHLVQTAGEDRRQLLEAAGLAFAMTVPAEPVWVDADATRLTQVIGNLLDNAVKFTDRGGRVEVHVAGAESGATVMVRDTGIGITADDLPRLFDVFVQGSPGLDRGRGGLGLGLALVKGLVEMHGGSVTAASAGPGQGATMTVRLPLADQAA